jgi:hypothetical protein
MSLTRRQVHSLTPFAKVRGTLITYPAEDSQNTQRRSSGKSTKQETAKRSKEKIDEGVIHETS